MKLAIWDQKGNYHALLHIVYVNVCKLLSLPEGEDDSLWFIL